MARSFESNGPDVKIRGTPAHIAEKYLSLARDAQSSGDPVLAENYLQHAEHYTRIIMAYREQLAQPPGDIVNGNGQRMRGPSESGEGDDFAEDEGDEGIDEGFQPPFPHQHQPQQRQHSGYEGGNRHEGGGRQDRPFRRDHGRFRDRDRHHQDRDRDRPSENRQPMPERQEPAEAAGGDQQQRRRERFPQQAHEQPEFLRRPVRRARSEGEAAASSPGKEEPPRE